MKSMNRMFALALVAAAFSPAWGQNLNRQNFFGETGKLQIVRAAKVAQLDVFGNPVAWHATQDMDVRDVPNWKMAFDSMSTNPTTLASWTNFYGANPGPQRLSNNMFKNFMFANDIQLAPGTAGKLAKLIRVGLIWNPGGTEPRSGTASCALRISCANVFDDTSMGPAVSGRLGGVLALFPNLSSAQPAVLELNLNGIGAGLPLPNGSGAVTVEVGTIGPGNTFLPISGVAAAQPLLGNMVSAGEPQFPGTNPSKSTDLQWDDDTDPGFVGSNKPDYVWQDFTNTAASGLPYAELYGYDATGEGLGILQAAVALFVDQNALTISGKLLFTGLADPASGPRVATFQIADATTLNVLDEQTVTIGPDGSYTLTDPKPSTGGNYVVYAQPRPWLRKGVAVDTRSLTSQTGKDIALVNGDIDGDNAITVFDYGILSDYFDKSNADGDWFEVGVNGFAPADADLDFDGAVTVFDYGLLSDNFDQAGD